MQHGVKRVNLSAQARQAKLEKDRVKIVKYRALTKDVLDGKAHKSYTTDALHKTTVVLNANPEFNAVWNYRRNILSDLLQTNTIDRMETLNNDLLMSMDMMKRFPKCYWIWNHRRWCLEMLDKTQSADWNRELAIASKVLSMDSRNFHGWHYRRYVVSQIEKKSNEKGSRSVTKELEINLREFKYTTEVINKSTSNFSAWHNRTRLIGKIFALLKNEECLGNAEDSLVEGSSADLFDSSLKLLRHELNLVKTGMFMDANDTSVWLYMQWLLTEKIFVGELSKETYLEILQQQLKDVNELNTLEKEDSRDGSENVWCLKTIIFLQALINRLNESAQKLPNHDDEKIKRALQLLVELDSLRKGHYLDQLSKTAPIMY